MVASGYFKKIKDDLPSLGEVKERMRDLSFQDLLHHRDLILFSLTLFIVLYAVYSSAVQPEKQNLGKVEAEKEKLGEEVQVLLDMKLEQKAASLNFDLEALQKEILSAEQEWEKNREKGRPSRVSKAIFLREITLLPYAFGWKILALEEVNKEDGEDLLSDATLFKLTGEGSFLGLMKYLHRIEHGPAPTYVVGMDVTSTDDPHHVLRSTLHFRVAGINPVMLEEPRIGKENPIQPE